MLIQKHTHLVRPLPHSLWGYPGMVGAGNPNGSPLVVKRFEPVRPGPEEEIMASLRVRCGDLAAALGPDVWVGNGLKVGSGDPDLLIATYRPGLMALKDSGPRHARVLAYCREVPLAGMLEISEATGVPADELEAIVGELRAAKAIRDGGNVLGMERGWKSILPDTLAIEAKVSKWKDALQQAVRNRLFTHRSYVALPNPLAERVANEEAFKRYGMGLISVTSSGNVELLREADHNPPKLWYYYYLVALVIAKTQTEPRMEWYSGSPLKTRVSSSLNSPLSLH